LIRIHIDGLKILKKKKKTGKKNITVEAEVFFLSPCKIYSMHFFFFAQHACLICTHTRRREGYCCTKPRKVREKGKEKKERKNGVSRHN
jgi:hypothetical protein